MKTKLFDEIGGLETLQRVHKIFYDKVYAHEWLKHYFVNQNQTLIENQQTAFIGEKMGGKISYVGKPPRYAHIHMYITEELFEVRQALLREALQEAGLTPEHINRWLKIDGAFKHHIVKDSLESFHEEYTFKKRIIVDHYCPTNKN